MRSYAPREPFPGAVPWYVAVSHVLETDPYPVDYHLIFEGPRGMPSKQVLRCAEEELKHTAQPERLRENLLIMPHHQIMAGLYPRARDELLAREETEGIYLRQ